MDKAESLAALLEAEIQYMKRNGWMPSKAGAISVRWSNEHYCRLPHDLAVQVQKDADRRSLFVEEGE